MFIGKAQHFIPALGGKIMKNSNNKKAKAIFVLFAAALMSSPLFAQDNTSLEDEILQQGNLALSQMKREFGQNAFWRKPNAEQLSSQLDEPDFAPETAATTDCEQQNISGEEKKTPAISSATTGQAG
ncbi:MAG TPA: hypothetical protein EYP34_08900 [Chromatiaceae bacterium]|nr:hypothetical protein [Chromatiaceae bacterium]